MTQATKAITLVTAFGGIGAVGAYAGGVFNNEEEKPEIVRVSINNKLKDEGFLVLDTTKDDNWQAILDIYKNASKNLFSKPKNQIKSIQELKKECSQILNKEIKESDSYDLARQWCVKSESIKTILHRAGKKLLKFDDPEETSEKPIWTQRVEELKKDKKRFNAIEAKIKEAETEIGENIKALKKGCKDLNTDNLLTTNYEFIKNFDLAKEWCSTNE